MSRARSASTGRSYGRARVLEAWGLPRSTFYNCLLAPQQQPEPVEPKRHDGTILAERPNQIWGIDATAGFTPAEGRVAIFAMVDHATAECLGIHVAKRGTRFEPLEPVRRAVHEEFGSFAEGVARGVRLRHDHGSQFMSDDSQGEVAFLGMESSPPLSENRKATAASSASSALSRNSRSGCETSPRWRSWLRRSKNSASGATTTGCWKGSASNLRGRLVKGSLPWRLLHDDNQEKYPTIGCGTAQRVRMLLTRFAASQNS